VQTIDVEETTANQKEGVTNQSPLQEENKGEQANINISN